MNGSELLCKTEAILKPELFHFIHIYDVAAWLTVLILSETITNNQLVTYN